MSALHEDQGALWRLVEKGLAADLASSRQRGSCTSQVQTGQALGSMLRRDATCLMTHVICVPTLTTLSVPFLMQSVQSACMACEHAHCQMCQALWRSPDTLHRLSCSYSSVRTSTRRDWRTPLQATRELDSIHAARMDSRQQLAGHAALIKRKLVEAEARSGFSHQAHVRPPWDSNTRCNQGSTMCTLPPRQACVPAGNGNTAHSSELMDITLNSKAACSPDAGGSSNSVNDRVVQQHPFSAIDRAMQRRAAIRRLQQRGPLWEVQSQVSKVTQHQGGQQFSGQQHCAEDAVHRPASPCANHVVQSARSNSLSKLAQRRAQQRCQRQPDPTAAIQAEALANLCSIRTKRHTREAAARTIQVSSVC